MRASGTTIRTTSPQFLILGARSPSAYTYTVIWRLRIVRLLSRYKSNEDPDKARGPNQGLVDLLIENAAQVSATANREQVFLQAALSP